MMQPIQQLFSEEINGYSENKAPPFNTVHYICTVNFTTEYPENPDNEKSRAKKQSYYDTKYEFSLRR